MPFPRTQWAQLYSTNPLERFNAEVKRRTNVVGHLPQRRIHRAARRLRAVDLHHGMGHDLAC